MGKSAKIYEESMAWIRKLLSERFTEDEATVVFFGSRVTGEADQLSDIDIGILPKQEEVKNKISLLRMELEESNIPFKVDLVDLSDTSAAFREAVLKEGVIWRS